MRQMRTSDKPMTKCNTVRRRAIQYLLGLKERGYSNELPLQEAKQLFSEIVDVWDRYTIKAYFGTQAHRSHKQIKQRTNYASGTVSNKTIELTQDIAEYPGYLQRMGLVTYSLKGHIWFMKVENAVLIPQLMKAEKSMRNLSLSYSIHQNESEHCMATSQRDAPEGTLREKQTNNNLQGERDKFQKVHEICLEAYSKHTEGA